MACCTKKQTKTKQKTQMLQSPIVKLHSSLRIRWSQELFGSLFQDVTITTITRIHNLISSEGKSHLLLEMGTTTLQTQHNC